MTIGKNLTVNRIKRVVVLDSYAVLAYLEGESGRSTVVDILDAAQSGDCIVVMSIINVGEVLYIVERERGLKKAHEVLAGLKQLSIEILPASQDAVFAAAHIKANFRISYADAFVVAAAQERQGIVCTGAPEFKEVENIIQVQWI